MAQAISSLPLTTEDRVQFRVSRCWICDGQIGTMAGSLPVLRLSSLTVIPPMYHAHLHLNIVPSRSTNRRRPGNGYITKIITLSEGRANGKHCINKFFFHFFRSRISWRTAEWWLLHCSNEWQNWMTELIRGDGQMTTKGRRQKIMLNPNHGQRKRKEDYWRAWLFQDLSWLGAKNVGSCITNARRVIVSDFLRYTGGEGFLSVWSRFTKLDSTLWTRIQVQYMEWRHTMSPRTMKGKGAPSATKLFLQSFIMKRHYSGKILPQERQQRYLTARINSQNMNASSHLASFTRNISELTLLHDCVGTQ